MAPFLLLAFACVPEAPRPTGELLYERHCASCHGVDARGDGPLASSLTPRPSDLTTLQARNGGSWDPGAVMATIDGRRVVAAHGPRDMPVWGTVFTDEAKDQGGGYAELSALYAGEALAAHLSELQRTTGSPR